MGTRARANGEGSIFPYRNGWAAYVWVTAPDGRRGRKWLYGKDREELHADWVELQAKAKKGPVATKMPTVGPYSAYWLKEIVEPNCAPATYAKYETLVRCYIVPGLGGKRINFEAREAQTWINRVAQTCQCCAQGKDAARSKAKRRCCAVGECCEEYPAVSSLGTLRNCLRSMLTHARDVDQYVTRNVAALIKLPPVRVRKAKAWSTDEARRFLESARQDHDPLYAAYVLVLVLGMRKGEVLGLGANELVLEDDQDQADATEELDDVGSELLVNWQVQRIRRRLIRREVKTEASEAPLPMPEICVTALRLRLREQQRDKEYAETIGKRAWSNPDNLVFSTRYGSPIEPRNFNRSWDHRCATAGVRRITVHDARRTCATLLVDLEVHPRVVMQILRHAQISVTMKVYAQVPSKATRAALRRLGASLGE
jgi:integrase